ncbi:MAG: hypothetical protein WD010_06940, partial [Nitriliruptor sp.]
LVLLWAALLVPSALRSRTGSPHATVGGFERAMDVLKTSPQRSNGRQLMVPGDAGRIVDHHGIVAAEQPKPYRREDPRVEARRVWFLRLVAGTVVSLVLAVIFGGVLWGVALLAVAATGAYVALLRRWKLQADQVRSVVRELEADVDQQKVLVGAAVGENAGTVRLRRWDG